MIAFLVLAHSDPTHLARLAKRLVGHQVFVHLDLKTPMDHAWKSAEVTFIEKRVPVYWGGFSQIQACLNLIEAALKSGQVFTKLVLISGSCYPCRPIHELETMFDRDVGYNYIGRIPVDDSPELCKMTERFYHGDGFIPWQAISHLPRLSVIDRSLRKVYNMTIGTISRKWAGLFTRYHGSQWWAISPECATYVLARSASDKALARAYKNSFVPDEQYFHSLIADSDYFENSGPLFAFTNVGAHVAANLHYLDPALQRWYTEQEFDDIIASGRFFIRKVSTERSASLLDVLDEYHFVAS